MKPKIAILQDDFPEMDRGGNRARVATAAQSAVDAGCELLALPELWCSGYDLTRIKNVTDWQADFEFLRELSHSTGLAILGGSLLEPGADGKFYNCAVAFDGGQELTRYRKTHLFSPLREDRHLEAGSQPPEIFDLRGLRCALSICYDLRFPELYRGIAVQGVDLIVVPAQWPAARIHHWRTLLTARAIENQCFTLGVNRKGTFNATTFGGNSMLVDPWGGIVVDAGDSIGLSTGRIDTALIEDATTRLPTLRDRREDLYG